jgi:hypothetical protein
MKRILLWFLVFGMSVYSLVTHDLRALAFALAFSFTFVGWDWVKSAGTGKENMLRLRKVTKNENCD